MQNYLVFDVRQFLLFGIRREYSAVILLYLAACSYALAVKMFRPLNHLIKSHGNKA